MPYFSILAKFVDDSPYTKVSLIVWCMYIGAVLGWAGVIYNKLVPGHAVRKILGKGLFTPESAQSPRELGLGGIYLYLLRDGSTLRRIVHAVYPEVPDAVPGKKRKTRKFKAKELKFFIPEELKYRAEIRYEYKKTYPFTLVFGAAALLAVAVVLYNYVLPFILGLIG